MAFLEAYNIVKDYSGHRALDGLNMSVEQGCVYGLLGPNGAGKTTFIRIVNQITKPDSGEVILDGHRLCAKDIEYIGYLPEERGLYRKMKVGEQAMFLAQLKGLSKSVAKERLMVWFDKFGINDWWNKKVEELSKGMQQKVQFIVTVLHEPKLLIFDEPFSGFDPVNANLLKNEILNLRDNGATILFSTHNMSSVEEVCDNITLINKSKAVLSGSVWDVKHQYKQNIFNIRYCDKDSVLQSDDIISVNSETRVENVVSCEVKAKADMSANELIRYLLNRVELIGFEEKLPTINDIFLNVVGNRENEIIDNKE